LGQEQIEKQAKKCYSTLDKIVAVTNSPPHFLINVKMKNQIEKIF